jgi:uncharacterized SAM-binding protein YcdF (DUF218 family)
MFILSKAVHYLIHPWHILILLLGIGLVLRALGRARLAAAAFWAGGVFFVVVSATPFADTLAYGLESRVEPGAYDIDTVSGAIVLGGATGLGELAEERGTYVINDAAERLTAIMSLRRRRSDLPILISGGSGRLFDTVLREPDITRFFLIDVGLDPDTIEFEEDSRNTYENAMGVAEMLNDRPGPYLLVTSAAHMPRALGCFRKAGIEVIAYPVDYRARPPSWSPTRIQPQDRFQILDDAINEVVGLVGYRLLGRTDALFPDN